MQVDSASHDRLLNKTVHFPVRGYESTYVVGLDVFHQLHCLVSDKKRLKMLWIEQQNLQST